MKKLIFSITLLSLVATAFAQSPTPGKQYKTRFSGKKVEIFVQGNSVAIQGYDGDEIVIEQVGERKELPKEADGLRMITGGVVDNTGVGVNSETDGGILKVVIPRNRYNGSFSVKIPRNLNLSVREDNTSYGENKWTIVGLAGELELKTGNSKVYVEDVSGPVVANTGYGKLWISYSKVSQAAPHSISATGAVDVTLPADTKANLKIRSYNGDVFTDFDIATVKKEKASTNSSIEVTGYSTTIAGQQAATRAEQERRIAVAGSPLSTTWSSDCDNCPPSWGKETFEGTINGGGVNIQLKSSSGNIYVRKKK